MTSTAILVLVIICAVGFDFTNGFHDTGNAMATSIATKALKPKVAVGISAILNLVGAFLSLEVAIGVTKNILILQQDNGALLPDLSSTDALTIVFSGLVGGILWNIFTWLMGLPSSSTHALFGGLIGAGLVATYVHPNWPGIISKIVIPALLSPFIAGAVAALATALVFRITRSADQNTSSRFFRYGQIATASLVSLAHGTGDAQKTMGVITLALIAAGDLAPAEAAAGNIPLWIILVCAIAIALGTYLGGWRIIRTLGKGLIEIEPAQGLSAEAASSSVILLSSAGGFPLSTTQVATGSILGAGVGKPGASIRWSVAMRMMVTWCLTLPAAIVVGSLSWLISSKIPNHYGVIVMFLVLVILSGIMFFESNRTKVDSNNVNEEWIENQVAVADKEIHVPLKKEFASSQ